MPNMREIAKIAGVSVSTVSSAISGGKYVAPELKRRILETAERMGYRLIPKEHIRDVAVILPGINSSFFPPLLSGISDAATEAGFVVQLCDSARKIDLERKFLDLCVRRKIRNVILDSVCSVRHEAEYFDGICRDMIEKHNVNIVVLEREMKNESFHSVYVNNYDASYAATKYLIELGRKRIVHISGDRVFPHALVRAQGYRDALCDSGIAFDRQRMLFGDFSPSSGYRVTAEMLEKGIAADAVFAANDQMAIGAMKRILQEGLHVPRDIAMIGFDNLPVSSMTTPSLTTMQYPVYQLGYRAMKNIVDKNNGIEPQRRIQLETKMLVRQSTDDTQIADWGLQSW